MIEYSVETLRTVAKLTFPGDKKITSKFAIRPFARGGDYDFEVVFRERSVAVPHIRKHAHVFDLDKKCRFVFDLSRLRTTCFFEKGVPVDRLIGQSLNRSILSYQSSLGIFFAHSASVVANERVYLFVAPSGGGKTTISRIARKMGFKVVNEEVCAVKMKNGRFYAGDFPCFIPRAERYECGEVGGLYLLAKSGKNSVEEISFREAMSGLLPESLCYSGSDVPRGERMSHRKRVFGLLDDLLLAMPPQRLNFTKDQGALACLK